MPNRGDYHPQREEKPQKSRSSAQSSLLSKLGATLKNRDLLQPRQKVLVAVSGGQDSVSLIFLLKRLQTEWDWELGIVHCDHQWSPSSRSQASHVSQIAAHLELDFYQAVATQNVNGESAARKWRYEILHRIASSHGYSAIVTAHTGSDRVETLLHNLFRGSGLHGLQALTWKRWSRASAFFPPGSSYLIEQMNSHAQVYESAESHRIALIRPLLDTSRKELKEFCDTERLPLWPDPSNFFMDIRRNKIRHQLLPFLRENFQPSIDKSLNRWAEIVSGEDSFLQELCDSIRQQSESIYVNEGVNGRALNIHMIRNFHVAVQRRVIKQYVEAFSGRALGFDHVEQLRKTCIVRSCKNGQCFSLPGDVVLQIVDEKFILYHKSNK
ncbi:hypothetical protein KP509_08G070300 [Ceratopteris richardii]|nr:hypothetical protein KP509_08G070300 [Ceratopteris richardii]